MDEPSGVFPGGSRAMEVVFGVGALGRYLTSRRRLGLSTEEKTSTKRAEVWPPSSITAAQPGDRPRMSSDASSGLVVRVRVQRPSLVCVARHTPRLPPRRPI